MRISVVGLGKLGSPIMAVLADVGFTVIGVDTNPEVVEKINRGIAPVVEPDLQELLTKNVGNYSATTDIGQAVANTEATFVIVPTPSGADGGFTLEYINPVMEQIGKALREKSGDHIGIGGYHLIVIVSTVMPGQTKIASGILEDVSGLREGNDFALFYSPTFIALGSVVKNLKDPDYVLIGGEDDECIDVDCIEPIYRRIHNKPIVATNWVNAEIAKIAQNAYIVTKITFANELSALCSHIPGANVDEVTRALGHDRRIGSHYLKGGLPVGGPCFPRDSRAICRAAANYGADMRIASLIDDLQDEMLYELCDTIQEHDGIVGILGMSYKPGTPSTEESPSLWLKWRLEADGYTVLSYDKLNPNGITSAAECVVLSNIVVLMHPDKSLVKGCELRGKVVIDPWRVLYEDMNGLLGYVPLGVGLEGQQETIIG